MRKSIAQLLALLILLIIPCLAMAGGGNYAIVVGNVFDGITIQPGACVAQTPTAFDLSGNTGNYSLQCTVTGDGTLKFEARMSNDGANWMEPEGQADIAASITKTSGPGSDGKFINGFTAELGWSMKVYACETGTSDNATITCFMAAQ